MNLYWVTTDDHGEDWFIVSHTKQEATRFHEDAEGYEIGDAAAEMILEIPEAITADVGWPPEELLESCGANIRVGGSARVVEIGGRKFSEGLMESTIRTLDDDMFEAEGKGRPNKTERESEH
ncbi:MAG: hypothetical protein JRI87_08215 [Deltaproteobacteria bacterium]|nr:hypothetical protein [Deltaproteobacteria bacterium]